MLEITKTSKEASNKVPRMNVRWAKTWRGGIFLNCFQRNKEKDILALTQQRVNVLLDRNYVNWKFSIVTILINYSMVGVGFLRLKADSGLLFLSLKTEFFSLYLLMQRYGEASNGILTVTFSKVTFSKRIYF